MRYCNSTGGNILESDLNGVAKQGRLGRLDPFDALTKILHLLVSLLTS